MMPPRKRTVTPLSGRHYGQGSVSGAGLSLLGMLDGGVASREHERLVAVVESHQVRRCTVRTTHLDDLAVAIRSLDRHSSYDDALAH